MNLRGPAFANVRVSQHSARKPQELRWHSWAGQWPRNRTAPWPARPCLPKI